MMPSFALYTCTVLGFCFSGFCLPTFALLRKEQGTWPDFVIHCGCCMPYFLEYVRTSPVGISPQQLVFAVKQIWTFTDRSLFQAEHRVKCSLPLSTLPLSGGCCQESSSLTLCRSLVGNKTPLPGTRQRIHRHWVPKWRDLIVHRAPSRSAVLRWCW